MKAYVGVTDGEWYRRLASRPELTEVNFWKPGGEMKFRALQPGEPFIFKTHWPANGLVGGGFYQGFVRLTVSTAWDFFGPGNGADSLEEMKRQISRYRQDAIGPHSDPEIGCIMLNEVRFVAPSEVNSAPDDFNKNIVQGKTYEVGTSGANPVIDLFLAKLQIAVEVNDGSDIRRIPGPIHGTERLVKPRLGQGGFQALVLDAYDQHCAITQHKIRPTLQAAHIKPVAKGGEHRLDNGLLLRSDVHTMFDRGYLGISPDYKLQVSPRLRYEFGNGDEFYALKGEVVGLPYRDADKPNHEFLEWHMDEVFAAS